MIVRSGFVERTWGHLRGPLAVVSVCMKLVRYLCLAPILYGFLKRSGTTIQSDFLDWIFFWIWVALAAVIWFIDHVLDADGNLE